MDVFYLNSSKQIGESLEESSDPTTEVMTQTSNEEPKPGPDNTPYEKLTLDGVSDHYIVTTDYCFIESEKYVLLLDKDDKIPGDFVIVLDAIIDELESQNTWVKWSSRVLQINILPLQFAKKNVPIMMI